MTAKRHVCLDYLAHLQPVNEDHETQYGMGTPLKEAREPRSFNSRLDSQLRPLHFPNFPSRKRLLLLRGSDNAPV